MARYKGATKKYEKRFKLLPESPVDSRKPMRRSRKSVYGIRLEEKQKLKFIYGVLERQFRRYFNDARKDPSNTGFVLMQILERRLDNVVYRLGFAPTRQAARQLVNHGHVIVNDKKVDIPSYNVSVDDVVTLKTKSLEIPVVKKTMEEGEELILPSWLKKKGPVGMVKSLPVEDDIRTDIDLQLIIEYYSK
ncbi:30S ribosomal protein S4 [candidate division WWE3 bacterium]|uniref:Small ribosomal subunit protein uS4 n=1 Tax=candidate division WWE3 bacterium TaxID=2053526 RepID=A0A955LL79_UNCKA|nr:30S ribosomal protein S4 [candidate division WWE3 bacterium]